MNENLAPLPPANSNSNAEVVQFENNQNNQNNQDLEVPAGGNNPANLERKKKLYNACWSLRWFLMPILFICFVYYSTNHTEEFTSRFPVLFFSAKKNKTISESMIPRVEKKSDLWNISVLNYKYFELQKKNKEETDEMKKILKEAQGILKRNITVEEFSLMYDAIIKDESTISIYARVVGFFNFINFIWLCSIIGIMVTVGPCMVMILAPFYDILSNIVEVVGEYAIKVGVFLRDYIIIPCHKVGLFEFILYMVCVTFIVESYRYNKEEGFYFGLTGIAGFVPCFIYSTLLFCPYDSGKERDSMWLFGTVYSLAFLPMALYYESSLLAWAVIIGFYACIGFSVAVYGLCVCIGFESDEVMFQCFITSFYMHMGFLMLKMQGFSNTFIRIFQQPCTVLGSVVLFIALLVMSSYHYEFKTSRNYGSTYASRQLLMLVFLFGYAYFGMVYGLAGMSNTALTFLVLYIMEKSSEVIKDMWILLFGASVSGYFIAMYLYSHKEFVISLFNY